MSLKKLAKAIESESFEERSGTITRVQQSSVRITLPEVQVGSICYVQGANGKLPLEVVSLDAEGSTAMPLDTLDGIQLGAKVHLSHEGATFPVGEALLGSIVDSMGVSYEPKRSLLLPERISLYGQPVNPLDREVISDPVDLGIRAINACLTCGRGQRQGIFAGSGVGKSVLLGMISRFTSADVVVIGLIGERGREVKEFIDKELGPQGRKKSVVVVETSDKSAVRRSRGAYAATAAAEYFRQKGAHVVLLMDSLTRFAMAQREIAIAAGEPPTTKAYPPSVFSNISRVVERAGNWGDSGSITGLYTVLVEGDDLDDPVADNCRAFLDGHIVLSRDLANRGHYPAVDVLSSVSRVMDQVVDSNQLINTRGLRDSMARYRQNEDAIKYGLYMNGSDPLIDRCIELNPGVTKFLRQDREQAASIEKAREELASLMAMGG